MGSLMSLRSGGDLEPAAEAPTLVPGSGVFLEVGVLKTLGYWHCSYLMIVPGWQGDEMPRLALWEV